MIFIVHMVGEKSASIGPQQLAEDETIPWNAIRIDLIRPTNDEDRKVQDFVGAPIEQQANPGLSNQPLAAAGLRLNGTTASITNRIDHFLRMNAQADQCIWINP